MPLFNLLGSLPDVHRDLSARKANKEANRVLANKFGEEYFDSTREQGYGGYTYDGRWQKVALTAQAQYGLRSGHKVLDIGCAKGFFVKDLRDQIPGIEAFGLDISAYAIEHSPTEVIDYLTEGNALNLPYPDNYFDAVFAINTLHNLDREGCIGALNEINRVTKNPKACFVQVDAYRTLEDKALFEDWMLTAKTYCRPEEWIALFEEANYQGDYFWTTFDFS